MDNQLVEIIKFGIPVGVNFILLEFRKKKWLNSILKWAILIVLAYVGILFLANPFGDFDFRNVYLYWGMISPLVFSIILLIFSKMSYLIQNRDFYLWMRGSTEIDDAKLSGGGHVKVSDRVISMLLLVIIFVLPFVAVFFIQK